jgi:hypothetical protein
MNQSYSLEPIVGFMSIAGDERDHSLYHRLWFLVDPNNHWLSEIGMPAREVLTLAMMHGNLVARAEGMLRLDIALDVIEDDESVWRDVYVGEQSVRVVDEGDLAAVWFGNVVGQPCRLVKVHPQELRPVFTSPQG